MYIYDGLPLFWYKLCYNIKIIFALLTNLCFLCILYIYRRTKEAVG